MEPLLFVIVSLLIGAATRHFLRKSPLPFTVMLLLIGSGLGVLVRLGYFDGVLEPFGTAVSWAGNIDPHLILFVFLPTLIFEAAFALDVHTFKKSLVNAVILAVPGFVIALVLTAVLVIGMDKIGLGLSGWGWSIALMFGAVISATDPVAVVAILKDLGASKKLSTLIEGESMLNDGTAIVLFMVFYLPLIGFASEGSPFIEFGRVVLGGTLLGVVIGAVSIAWVKRVFNDALVEITVVVAAAYLTFYIAEDILHVSGVLGLVAFGLAMAGVGKTRISPEVGHFLHEFWELAAFIANTLIFIIVGVVIAQRTVFTANDFLLLAIVYIGIHVIRAIMILMFYPIMRKTGYGLDKKDSYVLWYGALRGAIALALALVVVGVDDKFIAPEIKNQFLFLTAGTVALTLLLNATTIKALVNRLGLSKIPAVKALMMKTVFKHLKQETEGELEFLKGDRFLTGANWNSVRAYLPNPKTPQISEEEMKNLDTLAETRRRILEKEKNSYWQQFQDGLLGATAVQRLAEGVSETLDKDGSVKLSDRKYLEKLWSTPKILNKLHFIPVVGSSARRELSNRLALCYDIAKGFILAQEEMDKLSESMIDNNNKISEMVKGEIRQNYLRGLHYLKSIREANPEIAAAIETKQAIRSMLNHERRTVNELHSKGMIEDDETQKLIASVEERMKRLNDSPPAIQLPEPLDLLKEIRWLQGLDTDTFKKVVEMVENRLYSPGEKLVKEGGPGDGLFVIARGSVRVSVEDNTIDLLGHGSVIGEMAVLTGLPRTATVTAESQVTALWMTSKKMRELMSSSTELTNRLWDTAGKRFAENILSKVEPYKSWRHVQFRKWLSKGKVIDASSLNRNALDLRDRVGVLLSGTANVEEDYINPVKAPAIIDKQFITLSNDARVFVMVSDRAFN